MKLFKNLSIRFKVIVPVTVMGFLILLLAVINIINSRQIMSASRDISGNYAVKIEKVGDISTCYQNLQRVVVVHIIADGQSQKEALFEEAASLRQTISELCAEMESTLDVEQEREEFLQFEADYADYLLIYDRILKASTEKRKLEASALANTTLKEAGNALTQKLSDIRETTKENMDAAVGRQEQVYDIAVNIIVVLIVISIALFLFIVWILWRWVIKRLININKQLQDIIATIDAGEGDLTKRVQSLSTDEIGRLGASINTFMETLQKIMGQINASSGQLSSVVDLVSGRVSAANDNSNNISSVMEELSASMQDISSSITDIRGNVNTADENIIKLSGESQSLYNYAAGMRKRAKELEEIAVQNKQNTSDVVNGIISKLEQAIESSRSVERVNDLTNDILSVAGQTNLLSLNASIEAARAGEAGRGFAVVAGEISQLANTSKETAGNIQTINSMVINAVNELIESADSMAKFINKNILPDYENFVNTGRQYNDDAVHINEIVERLNNMSADLKQSMGSIADSINGINTAVDEGVNGVTDAAANTSGMVNEIGAIADAMKDNKRVAGDLTDEAKRFIKF